MLVKCYSLNNEFRTIPKTVITKVLRVWVSLAGAAKSMLVATKVLCRDKGFVATKIFCRYKPNFVAANILLSKTCFVATE